MSPRGRMGARILRKPVLLVILLLSIILSQQVVLASNYARLGARSTITINAPDVVLQPGNTGSNTIYTNSTSALVTATSGLQFYENANAQTAGPALDGSASASSGTNRLFQSTSKACASTTSCSQSFGSNVASGNILVVSIEWLTSVTSPSISDSRCSSWTAVSGSPNTNTAEVAIWYCTTTSAGTDAPSVGWTTSAVSKLDIYEIGGYTATGLSCNTGSGTTKPPLAVPSTTFSGLPFLVAAYAITNTASWTVAAGTGFTLSDTSSGADGGSGEYATMGITSPTTFPATASGAGNGNPWAGIGCAFPVVSSSSASGSVSLTTTGTSDVVYVIVAIRNSAGQTVSTVGDSSSLSYSFRQGVSFSTNVRVESWYATSTSALSSDTITITLSAAADFSILAFGVGGTDTASPFDPSVTSAPTNTGTGTSASTTITTSFPNDFLIGAVAAQSNPTLTAGTGFTMITSQVTNTGTAAAGAEDQLITTVQSGSTVSVTLGTSQNWAIIVDSVIAGRSSASVDTSVSTPGTSGSFALNRGSSAFLWSPAYTSGGALFGGSWLLDLWASVSPSSTLTVSIFIVSSSNAITGTILSTGTTGSIGTTKSEVKTTFSGSAGTIPTNGQIMIVLTATSGGPSSFTIYWGTGQLTNFQSPNTYNYVLVANNQAASPRIINFVVASSSIPSRYTNVTIWFTSPASTQIIVTNGALSQSTGSTVTLGASSTINIAIAAYANAVPTNSNSPCTLVLTLKISTSSSTNHVDYTMTFTIR